MEDIILYHGSRGGIDGDIRPESRVRCDFGKGFYLGEDPNQVRGLICNDSAPMFYTVNLKLSQIPENKILFLHGMDWLYTILANRKKVEEFNKLPIAKKILETQENYDVIIGPIADDRMNEAIKSFEDGALTDIGLLECLKHVNYGNQYVLKTKEACEKAIIVSSREMYEKELNDIINYSNEKRLEGKNVVKKAIQNFRYTGKYIDEICKEYDQIQESEYLGERN